MNPSATAPSADAVLERVEKALKICERGSVEAIAKVRWKSASEHLRQPAYAQLMVYVLLAEYLIQFPPARRSDIETMEEKLSAWGVDQSEAQRIALQLTTPKRGRPRKMGKTTIVALAMKAEGATWGKIARRLCECRQDSHNERCVERIKKPALRLRRVLELFGV